MIKKKVSPPKSLRDNLMSMSEDYLASKDRQVAQFRRENKIEELIMKRWKAKRALSQE